jgi:hypothetical protein
VNAWWLLGGILLVLVLAALLFPSNSLTGNIIREPPCDGVGCVELCEVGASACERGTTCCYTHWDTGVCDYPGNCERIREYSLYQTLPTYIDSVRQEPRDVTLSWGRFFLPLMLILGLTIYLIRKRD